MTKALPDIIHNRQASRFETTVDGAMGTTEYRLHDGTLVMTHTEVSPALQGRGIAPALVAAALDWARSERLKVEPRCSYVASYMERHAETQDLLSAR